MAAAPPQGDPKMRLSRGDPTRRFGRESYASGRARMDWEVGPASWSLTAATAAAGEKIPKNYPDLAGKSASIKKLN